ARDRPAWVAVYLQLRDDEWCRLSAHANVCEEPTHFLGMLDCANARRSSPIGLRILRDCTRASGSEQSYYRQTRDGGSASNRPRPRRRPARCIILGSSFAIPISDGHFLLP